MAELLSFSLISLAAISELFSDCFFLFRCMSKGFKPDSIDEAIEEYEELNVFSVNQAKTKLTFVDVN